MLVALFLRPKFRRMRNQAAARPPRRMLHMQHLVVQHILHDKLRYTQPVHPPVQHNLVRAGIVTSVERALLRLGRGTQLCRAGSMLASQFFLRIGGGAAFFLAFSASRNASSVPSTASSRLSL